MISKEYKKMQNDKRRSRPLIVRGTAARRHQHRTHGRVGLAHFGVHSLRLLVHGARGGRVAWFLFQRAGGLGVFVDDAVGRDLAEHLERVEPGLHALQLDLVVDGGDGHALDVDHAAVGFGCDLLALAGMDVSEVTRLGRNGLIWVGWVGDELVESDVVALHLSPMPPSEGDLGRAAVDLEHLPRKRRHHSLESLMRLSEV